MTKKNQSIFQMKIRIVNSKDQRKTLPPHSFIPQKKMIPQNQRETPRRLTKKYKSRESETKDKEKIKTPLETCLVSSIEWHSKISTSSMKFRKVNWEKMCLSSLRRSQKRERSQKEIPMIKKQSLSVWRTD